MLRPANGTGRIDINDVTDHQPIEKHFNGGEMLFDRRRRSGMSFDVSSDEKWSHVFKIYNLARFAPAEKISDRAYAWRVFLFRIFAVKNSRKRHEARSPAPRMIAGSSSKPARTTSRPAGIGTSSPPWD